MDIIQPRIQSFFRFLFFYNLIALSFSTGILFVHTKQHLIEWGVFFIFSIAFFIVLSSIFGLWFKKRWAYFLQFPIYCFQLLKIISPNWNYEFNIGINLYFKFKLLNSVEVGINAVALTVLFFLLKNLRYLHEQNGSNDCFRFFKY